MTKSMYAPWRMAYIKSEKPAGCVFCKDSIREDDLILIEGKSAFVMLNRYPYISGHLMVIPFRHVRQIEDLHPLEKSETLELIGISVRSLKEVMRPEGFNIGMNLGKAAGAGVDCAHPDVWVSMGEPDSVGAERIKLLLPYQVNAALMAATGNPKAKFLHCLPSFHNRDTKIGEEIYKKFWIDAMEATDDVFESPASVVFDQAENRLHTIKAVLVATLA